MAGKKTASNDAVYLDVIKSNGNKKIRLNMPEMGSSSRNLISTMFKKNIIASDINAQYVISFDVDNIRNAKFNILSKITSDTTTTDKQIIAIDLIDQDAQSVCFNKVKLTSTNVKLSAARVQICLSDLDRSTAHISVRACALGQKEASLMPIVTNVAIPLDAADAALNNPKNWNGILCGLSEFASMDSISITKRPMNPNRSTLDNDLLVHYPMDRINSLNDVSSNNLDAGPAVSNCITNLFPNRFGNGLSVAFNDNGYYKTNTISKETNTDDISISVWATNTDFRQGQNYHLLQMDSLVDAWLVENVVYFKFNNIKISAQLPTDVQKDAWNHYLFVASKTESRMAIYVNGKQIAGLNNYKPITLQDNERLSIGQNMLGAIDDIRIYNRTLSMSEINDLYTEGGWPVQSISLPSVIYLLPNSTVQLPLTVYPADAPTDKLVYSIVNTNIATVSNTGVITAVNSGKTTVTVSTTGGAATATAIVEVKAAMDTIKKIAIVGDTTPMYLNASLSAEYSYKYSPKPAITSFIHWKSSNESVATVATDGMITVKDKGESYIYVYANALETVKDSFKLRVLPSAMPSASKDTVEYRIRAIITANKMSEKDTAIVDLMQYFSDDNTLSFTFEPASDYKDSLQVILSGSKLSVYQRDTLVQTQAKYITVTATDADGQSAKKVIEVRAMAIVDVAPVATNPKFEKLYQFRKTAQIDLRNYVNDYYTPFERLLFDSVTCRKGDSAWIKNGILTVMVRPTNSDTKFSDYVTFRAVDAMKNATKVSASYTFERVINKAPIVTMGIDTVKQKDETTFVTDLLKTNTKDDFTELSKLSWSVDRASNVNVVLNGTILQLSASSSAWSGSENIIIRATDEGGKIGADTIVFTQTVSVQLDGVPQVDFTVTSENGELPVIIGNSTKIVLKMVDK